MNKSKAVFRERLQMKKLVCMISRLSAEISGLLLTIIAFLIVINLISRWVGMFIPLLIELTTFTFISVIYLGLANCEEEGDHIKMTAVLRKLPKRWKHIFDIFTYLLTVIMAGILTYAAAKSALVAYRTQEAIAATLHVPTTPVKVVIFFGLALFFLQTILTLCKIIVTIQKVPKLYK